jgi:Putative lumazine-binding
MAMVTFARIWSSCAALVLCAASVPGRAAPDDDPNAVAQKLGRSFAEAFFKGEPDKALAILHPALSKVGVQPNIRRSGRDGVLALTPGTLEIFARQHNADRHLDPATAQIKVDLIDHAPSVVLFRLKAAEDWFDYYLAAKVNGQWKLVNCVFGPVGHLQNPQDEADRKAVTLAMSDYANALTQSDIAMLGRSVHLDFERRSLARTRPTRLLQENLETLALDLPKLRLAKANSQITVLGATQSTAAARLTIGTHSEWVLLLKLDGKWRPMNSFWQG